MAQVPGSKRPLAEATDRVTNHTKLSSYSVFFIEYELPLINPSYHHAQLRFYSQFLGERPVATQNDSTEASFEPFGSGCAKYSAGIGQRRSRCRRRCECTAATLAKPDEVI
jgi:hypothetical protein